MPNKIKTLIDVHPNVIVVHQGDPAAAEMRILVDYEHAQDSDGVLDVITKGLRAQGRKLTVSRYDGDGNKLVPHARNT